MSVQTGVVIPYAQVPSGATFSFTPEFVRGLDQSIREFYYRPWVRMTKHRSVPVDDTEQAEFEPDHVVVVTRTVVLTDDRFDKLDRGVLEMLAYFFARVGRDNYGCTFEELLDTAKRRLSADDANGALIRMIRNGFVQTRGVGMVIGRDPHNDLFITGLGVRHVYNAGRIRP